MTTRWQAREPLPPEQNSFNLSCMNAALFEISTSQPSSTQSSQASRSHQSFRPSQSSELSDPFEILDFLKHWAPFQSALNTGQRSAPHMNNYVHPTRLRGGVRRNVPYEREEQARVDGRPYLFTDYPEEKDFAHHRSQGGLERTTLSSSGLHHRDTVVRAHYTNQYRK
ncbi:hypothetical protein D6D12_00883 [Aureobasidium pullulans]|uniref:Uncharacterized protein n=1 Tax=Aureobasidium pullulans TaxID=5580 RepID=A0AB74K579_AURPU|nr:hypothetical protein D6D12_00883 [Aureobasidium pullulans]